MNEDSVFKPKKLYIYGSDLHQRRIRCVDVLCGLEGNLSGAL